MRTVLMVGIGGFIGSVCRYLLSLLPFSHHGGFPFSTMIVNVLGALLIGILVGLASRFTQLHTDWFAFMQAGFCGGFTTFSTFALESTSLYGAGRVWMAAAYIALSVLLGLAAVFAGKALVS
jgi:fluoride exporter